MSGLNAITTIFVILLLAGVAWQAWQRRQGIGEPARWWVRVLVTAATMGGAFGVIGGFEAVPMGWGEVAKISLGSLVIMPPVFAVMLLFVELTTWWMRPARSAKWLAASILLFVLVFLAGPTLFVILMNSPDAGQASVDVPVTVHIEPPRETGTRSNEDSGWLVLHLFAMTVCGAIVWWSRLPLRSPALAEVFE